MKDLSLGTIDVKAIMQRGPPPSEGSSYIPFADRYAVVPDQGNSSETGYVVPEVEPENKRLRTQALWGASGLYMRYRGFGREQDLRQMNFRSLHLLEQTGSILCRAWHQCMGLWMHISFWWEPALVAIWGVSFSYEWTAHGIALENKSSCLFTYKRSDRHEAVRLTRRNGILIRRELCLDELDTLHPLAGIGLSFFN